MPSTSKSNQRKSRKSKVVPKSKPKQRCRKIGVMVKQPTRNWLDIPSDVMANIIQRIGVCDILENAQKVCTTWRKICKDPAMWRVIYMDNPTDRCRRLPCREMCKNAVDRSQGQLVDITVVDFCDDELLLHVAHRSGQLRRLVIACCYGDLYESWAEALMKLSFLEELSIYTTDVSKEAIETLGRCCPLLKTLRLNDREKRLWYGANDEESLAFRNGMAITVGKNLPELRHLELVGSNMTNTGLQAILDGCNRLESLDLRRCKYIDLMGDIGKRCCEQINSLKLPNDSLEDYPFLHPTAIEAFDIFSDSEFPSDISDDEYNRYLNGYHGYA